MNFRLQPLFAVLSFVIAVLLTSCGHAVIVRDESGKPIAGANIQLVTLSMNLNQGVTDSTGGIKIGGSIQKPIGINASHFGFDSDTVDFPGTWPCVIVLHPGTGTRWRGIPVSEIEKQLNAKVTSIEK